MTHFLAKHKIHSKHETAHWQPDSTDHLLLTVKTKQTANRPNNSRLLHRMNKYIFSDFITCASSGRCLHTLGWQTYISQCKHSKGCASAEYVLVWPLQSSHRQFWFYPKCWEPRDPKRYDQLIFGTWSFRNRHFYLPVLAHSAAGGALWPGATTARHPPHSCNPSPLTTRPQYCFRTA